MATDLHLSGLKYNTAAAVFFVRFFPFALLNHGERSLRSYTVSRRSRRKLEKFPLILWNNLRAEISFLSSFDHPYGVWTPSSCSSSFPSDKVCQCSTDNYGHMGCDHDVDVPCQLLRRACYVRTQLVLGGSPH